MADTYPDGVPTIDLDFVYLFRPGIAHVVGVCEMRNINLEWSY